MGVGGFFKAIGRVFVKIAGLAEKGFKAAQAAGLTDEITSAALNLVKVAAEQYADNDVKRAFVATEVKAIFPKVPDSVINIAIELAVQAFKAAKK